MATPDQLPPPLLTVPNQQQQQQNPSQPPQLDYSSSYLPQLRYPVSRVPTYPPPPQKSHSSSDQTPPHQVPLIPGVNVPSYPPLEKLYDPNTGSIAPPPPPVDPRIVNCNPYPSGVWEYCHKSKSWILVFPRPQVIPKRCIDVPPEGAEYPPKFPYPLADRWSSPNRHPYDVWSPALMKREQQMRESEGFDIDPCDNPTCIFGLPQPMSSLPDYLDDLSKEALKKFEEENGSHYEFLKVLKANWGGSGNLFYITFQAKDSCDTPVDFQAIVVKSLPIPGKPQFVDVRLCRLKPKEQPTKKRPIEDSGNDSMSGTMQPMKKRPLEDSSNDSMGGPSHAQGGGSSSHAQGGGSSGMPSIAL